MQDAIRHIENHILSQKGKARQVMQIEPSLKFVSNYKCIISADCLHFYIFKGNWWHGMIYFLMNLAQSNMIIEWEILSWFWLKEERTKQILSRSANPGLCALKDKFLNLILRCCVFNSKWFSIEVICSLIQTLVYSGEVNAYQTFDAFWSSLIPSWYSPEVRYAGMNNYVLQ